MLSFTDHTFRFNDQVFLIDSASGRSCTYGQFRHIVQCLAELLASTGISAGDRVAIVLPNCVEFVVLYFACLYLGLVAVPVNPKLHKREIAFILSNAGAKLVSCTNSTRELIPLQMDESKTQMIYIVPNGENGKNGDHGNDLSGSAFEWSLRSPSPRDPTSVPKENVAAENVLSITFTSGTTGLPKGVVHTVRSLFSAARAFNDVHGFDENSRFYHVFPMAYMAGFLNTLICPYVAGGSVVIGPAFDAMSSLTFFAPAIKYNVNTLWLVPTILSSLLRLDKGEDGRKFCRDFIRTACVGTAPLPVPLQRSFEERYGLSLLESYGLSETLFVSTNSARALSKEPSVGTVLPGVKLKFVEKGVCGAAGGGEGEICIKTPFQMLGYLNYESGQPDIIPEDSWFDSGDIGKVSDGFLKITGRKKDLIIRGGVNVSPKLVEDVLLDHNGVEQVAVVGFPHDFYGEEVVAAVKLRDGTSSLTGLEGVLKEFCRERLSSNCVPTLFFEVSEFPVSSTGKIQKAALREKLLEAHGLAQFKKR